MNQLTLNTVLTMSSADIAELTNKQHSNVIRVIESLLQNKVIACPQIEEQAYNKGLNKVGYRKVYHLAKRDTLVLVAQLSPEFTAKVIDRWQELESKTTLTVFGQDTSTHRGALLALVASIDKLEAQAPKVAYFDALVDRNLLTNVRDTAKELFLPQNTFVKWLLDNKYVYRDKREQLRPYSQHVPSLFQLKEFVNQHNGKSGTQVLITPKGRETFKLLLKEAA